MLPMALTAQASAGENAAGAAGSLAFLGLIVIGIVWLIFPFVVWAKLNRIIQNTRTASENLYGLHSVALQSCTTEQLVKLAAQRQHSRPRKT